MYTLLSWKVKRSKGRSKGGDVDDLRSRKDIYLGGGTEGKDDFHHQLPNSKHLHASSATMRTHMLLLTSSSDFSCTLSINILPYILPTVLNRFIALKCLHSYLIPIFL